MHLRAAADAHEERCIAPLRPARQSHGALGARSGRASAARCRSASASIGAHHNCLRLLSLRSTGESTGRISYAKLGIGQLGAVYETLISFTGVVAKTDLIEMKPRKGRSAADDDDGADETSEVDNEAEEYVTDTDDDEQQDEVFRRDKVDPLAPSWFVPRSRIGEFAPEEIVFDGPEARIYPKGSFIYRLAGRDREKSASYYTPEPLARLLVKHDLMPQT